MMLDHLGETEAARLVMRALESVARTGPRTRDVGGAGSTDEVAQAIADAVGSD